MFQISANARSSTSRRKAWGFTYLGIRFDQYEPSVEPYITCPVGDLPNWRSHQPAVTAGLLTNFTEKFSKAGNAFGTAVIEDNRGTVDMLIFGKRWPLYKHTLQKGALYFVKGQPKDDRGVSLMGRRHIFGGRVQGEARTPRRDKRSRATASAINSTTSCSPYCGRIQAGAS